jgi:hypothetical protein
MAKKLIPWNTPNLSAYRVAKDTGIPNMALTEILRGKGRAGDKTSIRGSLLCGTLFRQPQEAGLWGRNILIGYLK